MNIRIYLIFGICSLIVSCKSNLKGKELHYSAANDSGFKMVFINDSILEVYPKKEIEDLKKATYEYHFLDKEVLERMRENQPPVNFKTDKLYGQFYQEIALQLLYGNNQYLNKTDTLQYVKMRIDGKMTKRIYFADGNKFVEL